ncbi:hypothetical protein AB0J85_11210 [Micromonospora echinofusca]|uniref:hypothetical protein n=1 Tax=Micromonospora echinofusca TaxID=47858 RepID=UPI0034474DEB
MAVGGGLMRKTAALAIVMLFASLSVLGCSSTESGKAEPSLPESAEKVDMSTFRLPLDQYLPDEAEALQVRMARDAVMVNCVREFGFTVPLPVYPRQSVGRGRNESRYLLASASRARKYGYKWPELTKQSDPNAPALSAEVQAVVSGEGPSVISGNKVPDGGCLGAANRHLKIDEAPGSDIDFMRRMDVRAYAATKADSRVLAATARWSGCMERAGYHYPNPGRANDDPAFNTTVASSGEIATAVADVLCKEEVGLINLMAAAETAYQNREIESAKDRLREILGRKNAQIELARGLLSELR